MKEYKKAARAFLGKEDATSRVVEQLLSIVLHAFTLGLYWLVVSRPYRRDSRRLGICWPSTYKNFEKRYYRYRWRLNTSDGKTLTAPGSIVTPRCVMLNEQVYLVNAWVFIRIQRLRKKTIREIKKRIKTSRTRNNTRKDEDRTQIHKRGTRQPAR